MGGRCFANNATIVIRFILLYASEHLSGLVRIDGCLQVLTAKLTSMFRHISGLIRDCYCIVLMIPAAAGLARACTVCCCCFGVHSAFYA